VVLLAVLPRAAQPPEPAPSRSAAPATSAPLPSADRQGRPALPPAPAAPAPDRPSVVAAMARADVPNEPLVITVLGDSTGNDGDEWVAALARTISAEKRRTVVYYAWDALAGTYKAPLTIGAGLSVQPVTVWNGSAAGKGPYYSQMNLPAIAPQPSDVLIVSHGHNFTDAVTGPAKESQLIDVTVAQWAVPPAVAVVVQNPTTTAAEAQAAKLDAVAATFADSGYTVIDVASAFRAQYDLRALLQADGTHPNNHGQLVWLDTTRRALGI